MATQQQPMHPHAAMNPMSRKLADELQPLLEEIAACMDRGDAAEATKLFTEDATVISPTGLRGSGRAGVQKVLATDMASILKGTHSHFTVEAVRQLGDAVFIDATHEIAGSGAGSGGKMEIHVVLLAQKKGGGWRLMEARPYAFMTPSTTH
ncbi:SgcJ/EcaC family oxidoreductase [Kaistia terrae]|uniref:SgcJ/EcaC family oxidoreductase n=1 Tax=Kaistia terrae TaxID=537017 RepID=A0ABW0PWC7_9HYPH|nr:SgcJ/EcaC family oxidoreductase [Kaistia terrae]MCX5576940.1 SgcJ/EcaC family oxidoreductase [Kaistia terrae]